MAPRKKSPTLRWTKDRRQGADSLTLWLHQPGKSKVAVAKAQAKAGGWFSYRYCVESVPYWNSASNPRQLEVVQADTEAFVRAHHPAFRAEGK